VSGLLCFLLEEDWFIHMSPTYKIPVYSILGVSVCFALLFSLIDVINYCTTLCWPPETTRPLVNTEAQIYLVVATAVSMGLSFGFIFGLFDVEDEKLSNIRMALLREERYATSSHAATRWTPSGECANEMHRGSLSKHRLDCALRSCSIAVFALLSLMS
jgi:hypothetical protein